MEKQHEYNKGDEITVKIAAVTEINGKPAYEIKGIESIKFSEGGIDAMAVKQIKPGDIAYMVADVDEMICLDALPIDDVSTKEVKIEGIWFEIEITRVFFTKEEAEKCAIEMAQEYGYPIVKNDLFTKENENGD